MNNIEDIKIANAASIYAISNTPLFLERKLRIEGSAELISSLFSTREILSELKVIVCDEPATLQDEVRPYVYLIALSFKNEISYIKKASKLETLHYKWFEYIAEFLATNYRSATYQKVSNAKQSIIQHSIPQDSVSSTSTVIASTAVQKG